MVVVRRSHIGPLAGAVIGLYIACGEVTAEPLIQVDEATSAAGSGTGPSDGTGGAVPLLGLCDACDASSACGDPNDLCLVNSLTQEHFCGRDCLEGSGCPQGYDCADTAGEHGQQCVPHLATCNHRATIETPPPRSELVAALRSEVNSLRVGQNLPVFAEDACLDAVAERSARELATTDAAFGLFQIQCAPKLPTCECGWISEQQSRVSALGLTWSDAIAKSVTQAGKTAGVAGAVDLLSPRFKRAGVGLQLLGDEAFVSFTFAE